MIAWNSLGRATLFAALAAAAWVPWLVLVGSVLGGRTALALYLVAVTAVYVAGVGPRRAPRVLVATGAALLGSLLAMVAHSPAELALGLGAILATARSAISYRAAPARAVVTEVALVGGGLLFARTLAGPSAFGVMLAVWGFFLVQSAFFLVGGVQARRHGSTGRDPFEEAHARALALLEDPAM
jgi:hypothetical protein